MLKLLLGLLAFSLCFSVGLRPAAAQVPAYKVGIQPDPCGQSIPQGQQLNLDFGQMCKYEAANTKLQKDAKGSSERVVYFGDSITEFWTLPLPGLADGEVINRGISGQTTSQMLVRFKADVIELRPRVVHLMMGTNDIAGNTGATTLVRMQNAISSMAEQARANGIRVVLASIPPAKAFTWKKEIDPRISIKTMNAWIEAYAAREGFTYVDYYSVLSDGADGMKAAYSADGVHPNATGYQAIAPFAQDAIRRAVQN